MPENNILQILGYGTFYDFPRGLFVNVDERVVLLECDFDEAQDDYKDYYNVFCVVGAISDDLLTGVFYHRKHERVLLGQLPVREVTFDASRRKWLKSGKLEAMIQEFRYALYQRRLN